MKILIDIPLYYPDHCSGGEATMRDIAHQLISFGHEVVIQVDRGSVEEYEGIKINICAYWDKDSTSELYEWADVIITHLGKIGQAYNMAHKYLKPLFYYQHNTNHSATVEAKREIKVIYNAEWTKEKMQYENDNIVCRPIPKAHTKKEKGEYITLINANENKGVRIFKEIAKLMPNEKFLIVKGSYGKQEVDNLPSNITVWSNTPDMQCVYDETKILLCPSLYESWGRVATEAMSCGVPVISSYAKGLVENLGEKGIFCNRENVQQWVDKIKEVENDYNEVSKMYKKRFEDLQNDYVNLNNFIINYGNNF